MNLFIIMKGTGCYRSLQQRNVSFPSVNMLAVNREDTARPVTAFHSLPVLSRDADATIGLSGEKAGTFTPSV